MLFRPATRQALFCIARHRAGARLDLQGGLADLILTRLGQFLRGFSGFGRFPRGICAPHLCRRPPLARYGHCLKRYRRGGRVVDRTALEMRSTGNRIGGSNPSLSANFLLQTRKGTPTAAEFFVYSKGFGQTKRTSETGKAAIFGL